MIASVTPAESALIVAWTTGGASRFPYLWLRDNCGCALCRDPRSGQRLFDAVDLPAEPSPARASLEDDVVITLWSGDNHESRYKSSWLSAHDPSPAARARRRQKRIHWGAEIANDLPQAVWPRVLADREE